MLKLKLINWSLYFIQVYTLKVYFTPYTGCFTIVETKRLGTNPGF